MDIKQKVLSKSDYIV